MLVQEGQEVDFPLDLHLALGLVDPQQVLALGSLQQVVAVDRPLGNRRRVTDATETVIIGELFK